MGEGCDVCVCVMWGGDDVCGLMCVVGLSVSMLCMCSCCVCACVSFSVCALQAAHNGGWACVWNSNIEFLS